jgi:PAT family beta-lactamase induction signal transducer AmpG
MTSASPRRRHGFRDYLNRRVLTMLALGFSSGLPYNLIGNTLGYWLRDQHTSLTAIGVISWITLTYSWKMLWAPFVDRIQIPLFGRLGLRRGWILLAQIAIGSGLVGMAVLGTEHGLAALGALSLLVALAAATQDTAIDAWRIESAGDADDLKRLTSSYTFGFRIALLATEAVILPVAQRIGWNISYGIYGGLILVGVIACLAADEPARADAALARKQTEAPLSSARGLFDAIAGPFIAFFRTHGALALAMLLAITLYQLGYFVSGPMYTAMYSDLGLSKDMVGATRGTFGLAGTFLGVAAGSYLLFRIGQFPTLLIGGLLLGIGTALYAIVPFAHDAMTFSAIMFADNFGIAVAGITLVTYLSSLTSIGYTATQYALLSSAYTWAGKLLKGFSGAAVDNLAAHYGLMNAYAVFFIGCGLLGIPALVLFGLLGNHLRQAQS